MVFEFGCSLGKFYCSASYWLLQDLPVRTFRQSINQPIVSVFQERANKTETDRQKTVLLRCTLSLQVAVV